MPFKLFLPIFFIGSIFLSTQHTLGITLNEVMIYTEEMISPIPATLHRDMAYVDHLSDNNTAFENRIHIKGSINGGISQVRVQNKDEAILPPCSIEILMETGETFHNREIIDLHNTAHFTLTSQWDEDNSMGYFIKSTTYASLQDDLYDFLKDAVFGGTALTRHTEHTSGSVRGYHLTPDPISGISSICESTGLIIGTVNCLNVCQIGERLQVFLQVGQQTLTNLIDFPTNNGTFELVALNTSRLVFQYGSQAESSMNTAEKFETKLKEFFNHQASATLTPISGETGGNTGFNAVMITKSAPPGIYGFTYQPHISAIGGIVSLFNEQTLIRKEINQSGPQKVLFENGIALIFSPAFNISVPLDLRTFDVRT